MVSLKSQREIALMRETAALLSEVHGMLFTHIVPGVTTRTLDGLAEAYIRQRGATPSFKGYGDYTDTICASVNDVALHGRPNDIPLQIGDCLTIDMACCLHGFHADMAYTYLVGMPMKRSVIGGSQKESLTLLQIAKVALNKGIEQAVVGKRIGDIGAAIQDHVESNGFNVVKDYTGHFIGKLLHDKGPNIFNFGVAGTGMKLQEGMTIAIEPIVTAGSGEVYKDADGAICTKDGSMAAHYEHTVAIGKEVPDPLTNFDSIENNLR